jgi:integrase
MTAWVDDGRPLDANGKPDLAKASRNERFTIHDLRARAVSSLKERGRDAAPLTGHTSETMPNRVYDRRRVIRARPVE